MEARSARRTLLGRDVFFEYLVRLKIPYIFGNPGTTEVPLVDACNDYPSVRYILALHEDIAVAQAMGYARASGGIGVVNLHVTPGVAHALGNLYNAHRARVPLLVTAGQQHPGITLQEPILTSALADLVRPFTKWSYEVRLIEELPVALQRAFKELTTPPYGPVFLSLATNLFLEELADSPVADVSRISSVDADPASVESAAEVLASASNPLIVAGDGVGINDAWSEVASIADSLGAGVYTEGYATSWNFPPSHPQYAGAMPNLATEMRRRFDDVDAVLLCGITCQAPVARYDEGGPLIPWRVRTVSVDDSPWELGKNQPVDVGLAGDLGRNLASLAKALRAHQPDEAVAKERRRAVHQACRERRDLWEEKVREAQASEEITATLIAAELRGLLPEDAVFVDESISNRPSFVNVLDFKDPKGYFAVNGLSLGYSVGASVGIHLAEPERKIVNVVGDGSLLYYPQALWNAATEQAPVLFIVLNNASYHVLKVILERMGGPWTANGQMPPGLDFVGPRIDFVKLAQSMGVPGERPGTPDELHAALKRGVDSAGPYVVEVVIDQG